MEGRVGGTLHRKVDDVVAVLEGVQLNEGRVLSILLRPLLKGCQVNECSAYTGVLHLRRFNHIDQGWKGSSTEPMGHQEGSGTPLTAIPRGWHGSTQTKDLTQGFLDTLNLVEGKESVCGMKM